MSCRGEGCCARLQRGQERGLRLRRLRDVADRTSLALHGQPGESQLVQQLIDRHRPSGLRALQGLHLAPASRVATCEGIQDTGTAPAIGTSQSMPHPTASHGLLLASSLGQTSQMTSTTVVGASIAGLLSARAMADVVDDVVVLERERLDDVGSPRGHVPQGKHIHLLLTAGLDLLVHWFPGIDDELASRGAAWVDGSKAWVYQCGGYRAQGDWGRPVLSMTRPLLEHVVRRRVAALDNVRLEEGVVVDRVDVSAE